MTAPLDSAPIPRLVGGELDHIGIAVPDLEAALVFYADVLGLSPGDLHSLPEQGLRIAILMSGGPSIELISPLPGSSPLRNLLGQHTVQDFLDVHPHGGLHHLCYRVPRIDDTIGVLASVGIPVLGDGLGAIGATGARVLFFAPIEPSCILIEIKQTTDPPCSEQETNHPGG